MRVQHNIPAMNAYRNFSNNTKAIAKNLEKLSSGYRINRAGDDAAGLAISEKMRAQITGLNVAQKNAKDGISLVQTAEGALTEVHSMLNRMFSLAEQSANGTYDNAVDRANLQKEFSALRTEIDRIAESSNFNGQKLLDGSLASKIGANGVNTIAASGTPSELTATGGAKFVQELTINAGTDTEEQVLSFQYLDKEGNVKDGSITFAAGADMDATVDNAVAEMQKVMGDDYTVTNSSGNIRIEAKANGADKTQFINLSQTDGGAAATGVSVGAVTAGKDDAFTIDGTGFDAANKGNFMVIDGQKYQIVTRGGEVENNAKALYIDQSTGALTSDSVAQIVSQLKDYGVNASVNATNTSIDIAKNTGDSKAQGGLTLQIGDTAESFNTLTVSVNDMHAKALGLSGLNIGQQDNAQSAMDAIKNAINSVSSTRGDLGALQNRLEHTINNLGVMEENIQDAEATIRDTDVAQEMMAYTKNNILVQSAQAMLAQANQLPQGVLQLLG